MPKNNSKIRETEDLGLRIHRRAKQQSPQPCHKEDMAELKKFAQSLASINLQSHGLFNFRVQIESPFMLRGGKWQDELERKRWIGCRASGHT
jgi:hypothetical protein